MVVAEFIPLEKGSCVAFSVAAWNYRACGISPSRSKSNTHMYICVYVYRYLHMHTNMYVFSCCRETVGDSIGGRRILIMN